MDILLFLPETILSALIFLYLCLALAKKELSPKTLTRLAGLGAFVVLVSVVYSMNFSGQLFHGTYRSDLLSQCFKALIGLGLLLTVLLSGSPLAVPGSRALEYFVFLFSATLGMMMISSSVDLLTLFVSMELSSYSLYLLTALRLDRRNAESSVKYLILGAAGSGVFLWGASLVIGLSGTASFAGLIQSPASAQPAFLLGLVFILFAFLFKLSAAPMHFWAPDVYESAATPVTNFIATASKAAAVAILVRFLMSSGVSAALAGLLGVFAFISMTLGNTAALLQKDVKRLLAYSSIAQAGYILVGLLAGTPEGYASSLFYAAAYLLMNTGVFLVVHLVAKALKHDNPQLAHFDGLAERSPKLALLLLLSLLSLAGIPPLAGFTGKWILFSAAMDQGHWFLVLWAVLNSVVSLFYYLTLAKHAYLEKPSTKEPIVLTGPMKSLGFGLLLSIIALGIFPDLFISLAQKAVSGALIP